MDTTLIEKSPFNAIISDGKITLQFEGATHVQTARYERFIHDLFKWGIFEFRAGSVTLHIDGAGTVQAVDLLRKYRREEETVKRQVERY